MIRTDKRIRIATWLLICILAFIWGNSLMPGEISGAISNWVKDILAKFLPMGPEEEDGGGHLIRKLAHLTEFACLAALISWNLGVVKEKRVHQILLAVLLAMAAALVDETIQLFTPDRGPSLVDVWIDTLGAVLGMTAVQLGYHLKKNRT